MTQQLKLLIQHGLKLTLISVFALQLGACGQRGPLYLPADEEPENKELKPVTTSVETPKSESSKAHNNDKAA